MTFQLLVPMAGLGNRFVTAGYRTLKPMLPVHGMPLIELVLRNLGAKQASKVIVVIKKEDNLFEAVMKISEKIGINIEIFQLDKLSDGPADTCHAARGSLDMGQPLVIANSDQYLDAPITEYFKELEENKFSGMILAMEDSDPKWSFVRIDNEGSALEVREKKVISNLATCGVYGFARAQDFIMGYELMREAGDRTNGEFYVAPIYNYLISYDFKVSVINLGPTSKVMHGLGTPHDYEMFIGRDLDLSSLYLS